MDNVYVVQKVDGRDKIVVGVFAAHGLAEMAREQMEAKLSELIVTGKQIGRASCRERVSSPV